MYFKINPSKVRNAVIDLGEINKNLKNVKTEITAIGHKIKNESNSFFGISDTLAIETCNLDKLISKLATMEDGLERVVELYLQCEKKISDGEAQKSIDIKSWWTNVLNWVGTGVWNNAEKSERIRKDKAMARELKALLKSKRYSKKTWKRASVDERKQILKELINDMQRIYGVSIDCFEIKPIESEPGYTTYGYYADGTKLICINEDLLSNSSYYDKIMDTMAHEMRHAYQHAVVREPENFQVDDDTVEEWRENFKDYKTTDEDGFKEYRDQPVERDARLFASWVI